MIKGSQMGTGDVIQKVSVGFTRKLLFSDLHYTIGPNIRPSIFRVITFSTTLDLFQTLNELSLYGHNYRSNLFTLHQIHSK